ncbi:hypothetical protein MAJHIDBO_00251 [Propionibacterium freudenreichii subsp. shermanii]|nr:hypothetical protein MAJHIDBO_00251 [Propionibacterium freudenreichii subsp. shermanii]SPS08040.1 hypothetical protein MAJHIDBO_00251 [Propionibacterium freudenreichii subsp. shermanii]
MARVQLSGRRPDLLAGKPAAEASTDPRGHQATAAGPLGHQRWPGLHLCPPQPTDPPHGSGHDLHRRPRARRTGTRCGRLPGGHLHRDLSAGHPRRGGHAAAVPAVLHAGRDPLPRLGHHPGVDPRGRRTRLRPVTRLRCRLRQPRPHRGHRRGRRGGRDGPGGGRLEGHQLPQPGHRRGRAADPPPQWRQDLRTHRAGPQGAGGAAGALRGPRLRGGVGRGQRPALDARPLCRRPDLLLRPDQGDPGRGTRRELGRRNAGMADDHPAQPQGLDRTPDRRRQPGGGHLACPPGTAGGRQDQRGPS